MPSIFDSFLRPRVCVHFDILLPAFFIGKEKVPSIWWTTYGIHAMSSGIQDPPAAPSRYFRPSYIDSSR
jgi:hypothetical protein